ncbi:PQQ-binding-like beta-propeller repeat protein [Streptomyces monticola]|uniref:PQQ-binding-like beta-propeller repeat protein n=1 Tax=Streptomyces monticola TaxID=2666263 RepID=A0ABW2JKB7_9ACTN
MTQPPQPPNEPPKGGFGAPQDPPPGGFGAPTPPPPGGYGAPTPPPPPGTPPPAQPGYGYPQAPGQAPNQAPGKAGTPPPAAPGTPPPGQPGGYGYPGQQPQYGAYQQQPYGTPPPPPGGPGGPGGKQPNSQLMIIVAAVVAVALIVGGGIWFAKSSGDDGKKDESKSSGGATGGEKGGEGPAGTGGAEKVPSDTSAKIIYQAQGPKVGADKTLSVKGSWLTDEVYAKSGESKIVGYDVASGKPKWTLPLSGPTCAGSRQVSGDGLAAVVFEAAGKKDYNGCSEVAVFDLKSGEKLWQKNISDGSSKADFQEVVISQGTVAAGGGTDGGAAWDLKSGEKRWAPEPNDTCKDAGYAGGEQMVAVRECGSYSDPRVEVQLIDPASGTPKWTYKLPDGIDNAKVMSTKPVVFGVDSGGITASGVTDIFALDDGGKLRGKAVLEDGKYQLDCEVNLVQDCVGVAVGGNRVYVPTADHQGSSAAGTTNEVVAFDLDSGKQVGSKIDAGDRYKILPLRMDGSNLLAYKEPPYDKGGQVVTIDPKSGKQTVLLENPSEREIRDVETQYSLPDGAEMLYGNGRLFLADELMSKPSDLDTTNNLFVAFGTS